MTVRVGIPRGLLYYEYFPLWQHFFTNLGAEVIQSPLSTKQLLELGVCNSVDETCLPVKLYMGHVAALKDTVDYLFVPRIVSIKKGDYHCPKFSGLPDMVRSVFPNLPPILEVVTDRTENKAEFLKSIYKVGSCFTRNPGRIYAAYKQALQHWRGTKHEWKQNFIPKTPQNEGNNPLTIAVIGHSYNLYDNYTNNDLLGTLTRLGVRVFTPDHIDYKQAMHNAEASLPNLFWSLGKKLYGAAMEYGGQNEVDGVILVMAFECGPDSLLLDMVHRELTLHNKPVMTLVLDEHSGEAGLITRLEAFVDMVRRRPQT